MDVVQQKANSLRDKFGPGLPLPSQAQVPSLATFIHHGYITEVQRMYLVNIDLSTVAHASALADVTVTSKVWIQNVVGNIAPIISRIQCRVLFISEMRLSPEDTAALVQGMKTSVEEVTLGYVGGPVELDMNTLLTYDGRGHCGEVWCCGETRVRYGDQLATWGKTMGWSVKKSGHYVVIERK